MRHHNDKLTARRADTPEDYQRLGLDHTVSPWEDGIRTDGKPGSYEWWYFDAHLDDGSSLVVAFYTKNPLAPGDPLDPYVSIQLDRPGHDTLTRVVKAGVTQFHAATDRCDVSLGDNFIRGDLHTYEIHVSSGDLVVDATLNGQVPAWRPATGYTLFGDHEEHYFAWLPSVPQGTVSVRLTVDGDTEELGGVGYHDHNWGDAPMMKLLNHWYWGRAQAGPYSIVSSYITAERAYGCAEIPVFLLAKGEAIVGDDVAKVRFHLEDEFVDEASGKPVANTVVYEYTDGGDEYRVSFNRAQTIVDQQLIDKVTGIKHVLAKLARFDGSYLRFTGDVRLEHFVVGEKVEDFRDAGIWELMYFGSVHS